MMQLEERLVLSMPDQDDQDHALRRRLDALGAALGKVEKEEAVEAQAARHSASDGSALSAGLRASSELVAGVLVGGFVGYLLDQWLGSKPWLMVICLVFGIMAGFRNLYRLGMKPTKVDTPER